MTNIFEDDTISGKLTVKYCILYGLKDLCFLSARLNWIPHEVVHVRYAMNKKIYADSASSSWHTSIDFFFNLFFNQDLAFTEIIYFYRHKTFCPKSKIFFIIWWFLHPHSPSIFSFWAKIEIGGLFYLFHTVSTISKWNIFTLCACHNSLFIPHLYEKYGYQSQHW